MNIPPPPKVSDIFLLLVEGSPGRHHQGEDVHSLDDGGRVDVARDDDRVRTRLDRDEVEQHQQSGVRGGLVEDGDIVESEYARFVPEGDITLRTAAYSFAGQELVGNRLVEVGQGREFFPRRQ